MTMGLNATEQEITLYVNENIPKDRKTVAAAMSNQLTTKSVDVSQEPLTATQILQLAEGLNIHAAKLIDTDSKLAKGLDLNIADLDNEDSATLIVKNPELLRTPIAVAGDDYQFIDTPTDILSFQDKLVDKETPRRRQLGEEE